jgi:hypothetical protein
MSPRIASIGNGAQDDRSLQRSTSALCLGGAGAAKAELDVDVLELTGDPIEEAERLTGLAR